MSDTKVYQFGTEGNGLLNSVLPLLSQKGVDPAYLMGMLNNGNNGGLFGGRGFEDIIALIIVAAIFGNGNFGFGGWGNGNNAGQTERELLMSAIQRNGVDISQLAGALNCSTGQINAAIDNVATQICTLAGQQGLSFQQVINSVQAGNAAIVNQLASCCCDLKGAVKDVAIGQERGFASVAYETQRQTCDIEKAIAASTAEIMAGQRAAEMREMQEKIDMLREKNSQQAVILNNAQQTSQFAAMLAPIQADLAELKCNQVPVKKIACPETYVPVNNSINATYGLVPTSCGFGYGLGYGFANGWNGGSLWG